MTAPPDTPTGPAAVAPGKAGVLRLRFERRAGRTELVGRYQQPPLAVMRPLRVDPARPDLAAVYLMATGGGVVQGDRLSVHADCGPDTAVLLTTQAATRLHRCEPDGPVPFATQDVTLSAGAGSLLEYQPDPLIPFAGAEFHQRTRLVVHPTATVLAADTVLAGRLARGERHAYRALSLDLECAGPEGTPFAVDTLRLAPDASNPAVFAGRTVMCTVLAVTDRAPAADLADLLHAALAGRPGILAGVSTLPDDRGAWARLLSDDPPAVAAARHAAWDAVRRRTVGAPAPDLRKP